MHSFDRNDRNTDLERGGCASETRPSVGTRSIAKLVRSAQALDAAEIDRLTRILAAALPAK